MLLLVYGTVAYFRRTVIGNGDLDYLVALMDTNEMMFAVLTSTNEYKVPLYHVITPLAFTGGHTISAVGTPDVVAPVRPSVSLKHSIQVYDGDGSDEYPYIVA